MNIDKITLMNFRNVEQETSYLLNPKFTVIIGINGKGKSTILRAICIASGSFLLGTPCAKRHIWESEIHRKDFGTHLAPQTPVIVEAIGSIDNMQLRPWRRRIPENKLKTTSSYEDVGEIREIGEEKYKLITKEGRTNIDNPVIAYFGTGRLYGSSRNTLGPYIGREIFKYGYYSWYDMQYATYQYTDWLNSYKFLLADKKEVSGTYDAFFEAIRTANPYITAIDFDGKELRLKVKMGDHEEESAYLPLSLHSDGIITHTAMVAELAFRCIVLNAHHGSNAVKESRGIVMIDELDLHLHPNWQRHVVANLRDAFRKIQFIATTHSPFIVQSLKSDELINLDIIAEGSPDELKIDDVATKIMQVESAFSNENQEKNERAKSILELINSDADDELIQKEINNIADPGLRAFLELNKMAKGK